MKPLKYLPLITLLSIFILGLAQTVEAEGKAVAQVGDEKAGVENTRQEYVKRGQHEKQQRIEELYSKSQTYRANQQYEESLTQIKSLLAIEPRHEKAVTYKRELKDLISFHKQAKYSRAGRKVSSVDKEMRYSNKGKWAKTAEGRKSGGLKFKPSTNARVYAQFEQMVDLSFLTPEMSFGEAIRQMGMVEIAGPSLKIIVLWRNLYDSADIEPSTEINMQGQVMPLGLGLELLLKSVSSEWGELDYAVKGGVIVVATKGSKLLPDKRDVRVYNITDLIRREVYNNNNNLNNNLNYPNNNNNNGVAI